MSKKESDNAGWLRRFVRRPAPQEYESAMRNSELLRADWNDLKILLREMPYSVAEGLKWDLWDKWRCKQMLKRCIKRHGIEGLQRALVADGHKVWEDGDKVIYYKGDKRMVFTRTSNRMS